MDGLVGHVDHPLIVGGDQDETAARRGREGGQDQVDVVVVLVGGGFVEHRHAGFQDQRAGQGRPLLLAEGGRAGRAVADRVEAEPFPQLRIVGTAAQAGRQRRVLGDGQLPTLAEISERLSLTRAAVGYHVGYLCDEKLRIRKRENGRTEWKREALVSMALRYDLVRPEHLALLPAGRSRIVEA